MQEHILHQLPIKTVWSREEVRPKLNQYGGEPNASAAHLLVEVVDDVTSIPEDNRLGVVLSAIDFSKAFNRLDHEQCLRAFIGRGSSQDVVQLLGSFLSKRTMTVRVEGTLSRPRSVNAGVPPKDLSLDAICSTLGLMT